MVSPVKAVTGFSRNLGMTLLLRFVTENRDITNVAWLQWTVYSELCRTLVSSIPCSNNTVYFMNCSGRVSFKCLDCAFFFAFFFSFYLLHFQFLVSHNVEVHV